MLLRSEQQRQPSRRLQRGWHGLRSLPQQQLQNLPLKMPYPQKMPSLSGQWKRPLISELELQHRTAEIARQIALDFKGQDLLMVAILKGSFMFAADLTRRLCKLGQSVEIDFIGAASYGKGTKSSGEVKIAMDVSQPVEGRAVLLVDDIIDTGLTLKEIREHLLVKGAASVKTCVMLDKSSRRVVEITPDYVGYQVPDVFLVGFGLDHDERFRSLPYVTSLEDACQTSTKNK